MVTFIYMTMRNLNLAFISSQRYLLIGTDQLLILVFIFILICYVVQTITILIFFISKPMFITYMWFIMKVGPVLIINFRFFIIFGLHLIFSFVLAIESEIAIESTGHAQSKKVWPFFCIFYIKEIIIFFN